MKRIRIGAFAGVLLFGAAMVAIAGSYQGWFIRSAAGQQPDVRAEFRKIAAVFFQDSSLSMAGAIRLYDGEAPGIVKEENSFEMMRDGKRIYSRMGYLRSFIDGEVMIQLDTLNRMLVVADAPEQPIAAIGGMAQSAGWLFDDTAAFKVNGIVSGNEQERVLKIERDLRPEMKSYRLTYDAVSYRMKRVEIEWWKEPVMPDTTKAAKVWITHIDYQYAAGPKPALQNLLQEVLVRDKDELRPAEKYKDYQIHIVKP